MQDVLHLDSSARMNTPSAGEGNWIWRYHSDALHPDFAKQLAALAEMTDRDGYVPPHLPRPRFLRPSPPEHKQPLSI